MGPLGIILIIVVGVAVIYLIVKAVQAHAERERQRKLAVAAWGHLNGFEFSEGDPINLDARFQGLAAIGTGHDRYGLEVLSRQDPVPSFVFRYHYKTWETRTVTRNGRSETERYEETHWKRYVIVEMGAAFPGLFLRPENFLDKLAGFVGFDDIDFESEAFSKRYYCKSDNREFAYAVIHPQMMEWLLPQKFSVQFGRGALIMDVSDVSHTPNGCQQAWSQAAGFVNRIPAFVWQDYGKRAQLALPEARPYVAPPTLPAGSVAPSQPR